MKLSFGESQRAARWDVAESLGIQKKARKKQETKKNKDGVPDAGE